jgi:5-methylcytosine-specific restriction endonuclease McrA
MKRPLPIYGRVRFSKKIRYRIFKRDNFTCKKCGSKKHLTIDHIIPVSEGGSNRDNNLHTLCNDCNQAKKADILPEFIRI